VLGSMRLWNCGDVLYVLGVSVSCEAGSVFPIGEYKDGTAWNIVSMGMGAVDGLFQRGREFVWFKFWKGHGCARPCCVCEWLGREYCD